MSDCDPTLAAAIQVLDAAYHYEGCNSGDPSLESPEWNKLKQRMLDLAAKSEPPVKHRMLWIKWYRFTNRGDGPLSMAQVFNAWEIANLTK